jgi:hypothetical protein
MNTFAPVFKNIVHSSLWSEPDYVCKVFVTLMAIKDSDHVARVTAFALGRMCWSTEPHKAEERAMAALKLLESPDLNRAEPQRFDGRRIKRVDDGWLILNGQYYEDEMRKVSRKIYKAKKQREYRNGGKPLPGEAAAIKALEAGLVDKDFQPVKAPIGLNKPPSFLSPRVADEPPANPPEAKPADDSTVN